MSENEKGKRQKERPILFSTDMVRAILEGRKTETRRVITSGNTTGFAKEKKFLDFSKIYPNGSFGVKVADKTYQYDTALWRGQCKWQTGDLLYVRESYCPKYFDDGSHGYKADWTGEAADIVPEPKWKPSIHMPKKAARIWLKVKDVKVERVQEIKVAGIISEGIEYLPEWDSEDVFYAKWIELWDSINADRGYSWDSNPWVWVVKFDVVSTNGKPEADHA